MVEQSAYCWKTEYVAVFNGEDDSWHDDIDDALDAAHGISLLHPDDEVYVQRMRHFATERNETASFCGGAEVQHD